MFNKVMAMLLLPFLLLSASPVSAADKEMERWQDGAVYYILVDRFLNGDGTNDNDVDLQNPNAYQGGDFKGIIEKLDYIKEMGFTTIALNPIYENAKDGYHGDWTLDFKKINKHFGSLEDFKNLVQAAHDKNMKVIIDFNANHVAAEHPWLSDAKKKDWFHAKADQQNIESKWMNGLPDLNQENPEVKTYLIDAAKWWINQTDIDGYRLKDYQYISKDFWQAFGKEVKSVKEDFILFGEISPDQSGKDELYRNKYIDSFLDFSQMEAMSDIFARPDKKLDSLFTIWDWNEKNLHQPEYSSVMIDQADTVRFTKKASDQHQFPGTRWKMALTYMYTVPGIPTVYYGSEIALNGGETPENRKMMDFRTDKELIDYITELSELRNEYPALRKGTIKLLGKQDGMAVFERKTSDQTILVAINNSSKTKTVKLDDTVIGKDKELRGRLAGNLVKSKEGELAITLERETSEVFLVADESGINMMYIFVMVLVNILFFSFLYLAWKKGKQKKVN